MYGVFPTCETAHFTLAGDCVSTRLYANYLLMKESRRYRFGFLSED